MNSTTVGPGDSIIAPTIEQKRSGRRLHLCDCSASRRLRSLSCMHDSPAATRRRGTYQSNNSPLPHHSDAISSHRQTPILRGLTRRTPPASSSNAAAGSCVSLSLCGKSGNGLFILQCRSTAIPVLRVVSNTWPEQHSTAQRIQPASPVAGTDR